MKHEPLRYRLTMLHRCGNQFQMNTTESPPELVICPGCAEILVLDSNSFDDGAQYSRRGNYWKRKQDGLK